MDKYFKQQKSPIAKRQDTSPIILKASKSSNLTSCTNKESRANDMTKSPLKDDAVTVGHQDNCSKEDLSYRLNELQAKITDSVGSEMAHLMCGSKGIKGTQFKNNQLGVEQLIDPTEDPNSTTIIEENLPWTCLLYTSDAADE